MAKVHIPSKDREINEVVSWLDEQLGPTFRVVDHWDGDMCAIGVAAMHDPKQLVYISSWNHPSGRYSAELETAPTPGSELPYSSIGKFAVVERQELALIVTRHLGAGS